MNREEILEKLTNASNLKQVLLEVIDGIDDDTNINDIENIEVLRGEVKKLYQKELLEILSDMREEIEKIEDIK